MKDLILIAPKAFREYSAEDYRDYVISMFALPTAKRGAKPPSAAPGLCVGRTKSGALSLRRTKLRAFAYVTRAELAALAQQAKTNQSDLWNLFTQKKYLITDSRMTAEKLYAETKGVKL